MYRTFCSALGEGWHYYGLFAQLHYFLNLKLLLYFLSYIIGQLLYHYIYILYNIIIILLV